MTTLTLNQDLNGIEIRFDEKPLQATLDGLKKLGFRWHRQKKLWYAKQTPDRLELAQAIANGEDYAEQIRKEEPKKKQKKAGKKNAFGVKVGDIFSASWGYEQTNNDFFQVIALVGEKSVRVREVHPPINGDLKRLKPGYYQDEQKAKEGRGKPAFFPCAGALRSVRVRAARFLKRLLPF